MRTEWLIVGMFLLLLVELQGCSPKIVEHYQTVHDTTYVAQHFRDSIFERDSIFVKEKSDTVYQYVEKWRIQYRDRTDTVYQAVRDTTVVHETQLVPRPRTWWDKTKNYIIAALAAALVWAYRKQILKLLKTL